jgi:two-component system sensor histidine kinase UhpB
MLGYTAQELANMTVFDVTLEADKPRLREVRAELFSGRRDRTRQEKRVRRKSGDALWINHIVAIVRPPMDAPAFTIELIEDIGERKHAEEEAVQAARTIQALSEQRESQIRLVIDTIPAIVWRTLPDGTLDFTNKRWREYTGRSLGDAVEESTSRIHPDDFPRVMPRWQEDMACGRPGEYEMRLRRADGEYRWFMVRIVPLRDEQGTIVQWYGTSTDIEDRKQAADALRESEQKSRRMAEKLKALTRRLVELQEKERRDIARELHDRVGQTLTAMRINMDLIRKRLDERDDPSIRSRNEDSCGLIESAFKAVKNVMYELRPPMLEEHGLVAPLQWYAKLFTERTGIRVEVRGDEDRRCRPEVELALFRIAQEALTNVARHAQARRVQIELRDTGEGVVFTIEDDGKGFDGNGERRAKSGYGLITMRERAEAVGGAFEASSASGRGARITVKAPRQP